MLVKSYILTIIKKAIMPIIILSQKISISFSNFHTDN